MSVEEMRDCEGFRRIYDLHNEGKVRGEKVTCRMLADFARPFGGAKYPSQWRAYKSCSKPIPLINKLIVVLFYERYTPQEIFPSWQFPSVTQLAPKSRVSIMVYLLGTRQHAVMGNALLSMAEQYEAAGEKRRARLLRDLRGLIPGKSRNSTEKNFR